MNSKVKSLFFSLIAVMMGFFVVLLVLEITLRFFPVFSGMPVNRESAIYSFIPNTTIQRSNHWDMTGARKRQVNNVGFISDQAYIAAAQSNNGNQSPKSLIAIIGDSYIEAMQVDYANTTEANLLKNCYEHARVYSFGAQFAPLSQYLSWVDYASKTFAPKAMVINIVGNDFDESLLSYQLSSNGGGVPGMQFFELTQDTSDLVIVPFKSEGVITRLLRHSVLAQYLVRNVGVVNLWKDYRQQLLAPSQGKSISKEMKSDNKSDTSLTGVVSPIAQEPHSEYVGNAKRIYDAQKLQDSQKAVDEFLRRLPQLANLPPKSIVLSVDAERPQIYTLKGRQDVDSFFSVMRAYFIKQARAQGFEVLDLRPAMIAQFDRTGERFEFSDDNHWNAAGHQLLASQLLRTPAISALCLGSASSR
jgi:hypothetical protein